MTHIILQKLSFGVLIFVLISCASVDQDKKSHLSDGQSSAQNVFYNKEIAYNKWRKVNKLAIYVPKYQSNNSRKIPYRQIESKFMEGLIYRGFNILARSDMSILKDEHNFQNSGVVEKAIEYGKMLGSEFVVILEVTNLEINYHEGREHISDLSMSARLINIKTAIIDSIINNKKKKDIPLLLGLILLPFYILFSSSHDDAYNVVLNSILNDIPFVNRVHKF